MCIRDSAKFAGLDREYSSADSPITFAATKALLEARNLMIEDTEGERADFLR